MSGGFLRYGAYRRRAVTQSPEVSMLRAICACTASTSSISEGGEIMHSPHKQRLRQS